MYCVSKCRLHVTAGGTCSCFWVLFGKPSSEEHNSCVFACFGYPCQLRNLCLCCVYIPLIYCVSTSFVFEVNEHKVEEQ